MGFWTNQYRKSLIGRLGIGDWRLALAQARKRTGSVGSAAIGIA